MVRPHMKRKRCNYCKECSPETNPFCSYCGRSFGVRLCPRLHPNPARATYCGTCGSRDLSLPHPPRPLGPVRLILFLVLIPAVVLLAAFFFLSTFQATFVH